MSHVIHVNESCHTCECVILHIWMSHVTHINTHGALSKHIDDGPFICLSHVTHTNESCHTYERVMSHIRIPCRQFRNSHMLQMLYVAEPSFASACDQLAFFFHNCPKRGVADKFAFSGFVHIFFVNPLLLKGNCAETQRCCNTANA